MLNKAKIDRYIEYLTTKLKMFYKQKQLKSNGTKLKYILEKNDNSQDLIIVFSGMPRPGIKARYNYMRTLKNIRVNKLFILDDFGYDGRGAYYLGKDRDFKIERAVLELIDKIKRDLLITRTIYCGSSKGGWAAMYFGMREKQSTIIAGGLQYRLGHRLTVVEILRTNTMPYIMGENYTPEDVEYLNDLLKNIIIENRGNNNKIYLHYSDSESTYDRYMKYLLEDLNMLNIPYQEDIEHYKSHNEIAFYFPPYLINTLKKEGVH